MTDPLRAEHGGAFFEAIGVDFRHLETAQRVVNADVLDAWYEPSPNVVSAIRDYLAWLIKTSPPTYGEGLTKAISECRNVSDESILLGSGSSSLIFWVLPKLFSEGDRVTVMEPTYGEYAHVLKRHGAKVEPIVLDSESDFQPNLTELIEAAKRSRLTVLVNPNTPTGTSLSADELQELISALPSDSYLWIDETYVDFDPNRPTMEAIASKDRRVVVCKSMSKFYALSGLRVGYFVAHPDFIRTLAPFDPPWGVGMLAQLAAVEALRDVAYYHKMAELTRLNRDELVLSLSEVQGLKTFPSVANFVLCKLDRPLAADLIACCESDNVFLRNCDSLSSKFGGHYIRTAVKNPDQNKLITNAIKNALMKLN